MHCDNEIATESWRVKRKQSETGGLIVLLGALLGIRVMNQQVEGSHLVRVRGLW